MIIYSISGRKEACENTGIAIQGRAINYSIEAFELQYKAEWHLVKGGRLWRMLGLQCRKSIRLTIALVEQGSSPLTDVLEHLVEGGGS